MHGEANLFLGRITRVFVSENDDKRPTKPFFAGILGKVLVLDLPTEEPALDAVWAGGYDEW